MNKIANGINFKKAVVQVSMFVVLLTIFTYFIIVYNNRNIACRTGEVMVNQVSGILEKNREAEKTLLASLKEDYIIRAKTVSYMLEHMQGAEYDVYQLNRIAYLMGIDEIHIFDEAGIIYSGTTPRYYGYSFDSGEQMGYFKPMLEDKTLSMCQDVTPNTAEGKSMMYAIVWDSNGEKMIQVGVEPVRLLQELKKNDVSNVINSLPVYDGTRIYVASADTGIISGATDGQGGILLSELGIDRSNVKTDVVTHKFSVVNGHGCECSILINNGNIICVVQDNAFNGKETLISMTLIVICLSVASVVLLLVIRHMLIMKNEQVEQLMILSSMAEMYYSMHILDLEKKTIRECSARNQVKEAGSKYRNMDAVTQIRGIMEATMTPEYLEQSLEFTNIHTLSERLMGKKSIYMDLLGKNVGWIRMLFITISTDDSGKPDKAICTTQIIDEEKRREEQLILESTTDKLTHCYNRRAYDNDLHNLPDVPTDEDFVFVSIDVNGLKQVNDTMGHAAGDELLMGAAGCMKRCFGRWGKVYRTGGDEFAVILNADINRLEGIKETFDKALSEWSGEIVKELSVSCGYVTKTEYPDSTITEMAKTADDRMYKAKSEYYKKKGITRDYCTANRQNGI